MSDGPEGLQVWDNERFDGGMRSRFTVIGGKDGAEGEIDPGQYNDVPTRRSELVTLRSGRLTVSFPGGVVYTYVSGQSFRIPAGASFSLVVHEPVTYQCIYNPDPTLPSGF